MSNELHADLERIYGRLDWISNALAGVGTVNESLRLMGLTMTELSANLTDALALIQEETSAVSVGNVRLEAKVDQVHTLVNSMYTASLDAQVVILEQLVKLQDADIERLGSNIDDGALERRETAVGQLRELHQVLREREAATAAAEQRLKEAGDGDH